MNNIVQVDRVRRLAALRNWVDACREDLGKKHRYPDIDIAADSWPLRSRYKTQMADINLQSTLDAFAGLEATYADVVRCITAEWVISGKHKLVDPVHGALKLLAQAKVYSVLELKRADLRRLESEVVEECKRNPAYAGRALGRLQRLAHIVATVGRRGVIDPQAWNVGAETQAALNRLREQRRVAVKEAKASTLDRQIEALSDAMSAMFNGDERLSHLDRAALATMGVMMCAPTRVNEPLCMAVDDVITIEDYLKRPDGQDGASELGRAHMLLLQKGSKGAPWSAKPALNFMTDLLKLCVKILIDGGTRSRTLAQWYEENPNRLYLPPSLEHHRGQLIDRFALAQIMSLSDKRPDLSVTTVTNRVWRELGEAGKIRLVANPRPLKVDGSKNARRIVQAVAWDDAEGVLLQRVNEALKAVRRVTPHVFYEGRVSNMLMLFDHEETRYLPGVIKYQVLLRRFKQTQRHREWYRVNRGTEREPTVFEKLGLTMVVDGRVEYAWIDTHDPRRWLTTQAMLAPDSERYSNVLLNKWARRVNVDQLKHYDLRSETQKAEQATMPAVEELADISHGLQKIEGIEAQYGLKTEIITAHEAGVSVTSMEAIASAVEDRPVARTSTQLIILYPSRFGMCLHQHHETPCRSYSSCLPCHEDVVVKGHLPTNDEVRKRDQLLRRSIASQLERLVTAHNRQIADSPEGLESHILALVRQGLSAEEMADELIQQFHEIKDRIASPCLRSKLEEAYVARGMVQRLDDPTVASGALMRYHNPGRHASPGHERALDAHGGRAAIGTQLEQFHSAYPQFAPTNIGVKDEREMLERDDEDDDE